MDLKKIRRLRGVSQQELADHLGVSKQMVSMWENNLKEKIPEKRIRQIAEFLGVPIDMILQDNLDMSVFELYTIQDELEKLKNQYKKIQFVDSASDNEVYNNIMNFYSTIMSDGVKAKIEEPFDGIFQNRDKLEIAHKFFKLLNREEITESKKELVNLFVEVYSISDNKHNKFSVELFKLILLAENGELVAEEKLKFVEKIIQLNVK